MKKEDSIPRKKSCPSASKTWFSHLFFIKNLCLNCIAKNLIRTPTVVCLSLAMSHTAVCLSLARSVCLSLARSHTAVV